MRGETLREFESMQAIYRVALTPKEYADQSFEKQVGKPENCAHCGRANSLEALGFYSRWVSHLLEALRIRVRRFICLRCRVSISCLPDFAQPYRVVQTATVQAGFREQSSKEVLHWGWLIVAYWKKFSAHLPQLLGRVGSAFGPCPAGVDPKEFWRLLMDECPELALATRRLVDEFHTCLYGHYRCHQGKDFSK